MNIKRKRLRLLQNHIYLNLAIIFFMLQERLCFIEVFDFPIE